MKFKFRRYFLYYLGRIAVFFIGFLPRKAGLYISGKAGSLAYLLLPKYRNLTLQNLRSAFGDGKSESELRSIAKRVFENLGKNAFELISFPKLNKSNIDSIVGMKGKEYLEDAYKKGKGIVLITGHFGNWELLAVSLRLKGYPGVSIGRRLYFKKYDDYLNRLRKLHDVNIIYRDDSPRKALRVLKSNGIVGVVADQDVDSVAGVFVDFFGKGAYTPVGPVALAKASGAALLPVLIAREGSAHTIICDKPIELTDTGDKEKDLITNTQRWSSVLESYIRRYPEQWVWMHRRWKTQVPEHAGT